MKDSTSKDNLFFKKEPPYRIQRKAARWVGEDIAGGFVKLLAAKVCPAEGERE